MMAAHDPRLFIPWYIENASKGHIESARLLAEYAATFLEAGAPMPVELSAWLGQAMRAIASGADAGKALGTKRRKGGQWDWDTEIRNIQIAEEVLDLVVAGETHEEAIGIVADKRGVSDSTVRDAFRAWRAGIDATRQTWHEEDSDSQMP